MTGPSSASSTASTVQTRSGFAGWTGVQSKRRAAPAPTGRGSVREEVMAEMDPAFARTLGLTEGSKV